MDQNTRQKIKIQNEKGILHRSGGGFHTPQEFAVRNLFYVAWSGQYECSSLYSVERESLDFYSVIYVLEGQLELEYEDTDVLLKKDEAILMDFRKPHAYRAASDRLIKWEMLFNGNVSEAWFNLIAGQGKTQFKVSGRLNRTIRKLREELESPIPRDHMISMLIHTMFCDMLEQNSMKLSPPIEDAVVFINSQFGGPLQVSEIADYVSLSRYYFTRLFRKETGRTPNEYLAEVRINAAKEMLTDRVLSISEIAEKCGFANTSHFTRFFREKTGQTPAAFRNFFHLKDI